MAISNEAGLVWQKALRKLSEAAQMPTESFPGIVMTGIDGPAGITVH